MSNGQNSNKVITWIINHDDKRLFTILYIGSAVILSIAISLFWLVVVVGIHYIFETIKQYQIDGSIYFSAIRASWEILLDIALIIFSFVLVLYLEMVLGAAGLGAATRVGVQSASGIGVRFAGFQRAIRGILLSIDDVLQISKSFLSKPEQKNIKEPNQLNHYGGWSETWLKSDFMIIGFLFVSLVLITVVPITLDLTFSDAVQMILEELQPLGN